MVPGSNLVWEGESAKKVVRVHAVYLNPIKGRIDEKEKKKPTGTTLSFEDHKNLKVSHTMDKRVR